MKNIAFVLLVMPAVAGFHTTAAAWASANRYGGHSSGGDDQVEHTNAFGGSTTHNWDGGTSHTNAYGGTTTGRYGAGVVHTSPDGYSTYRPPEYGRPGYAPYHPPVPVYSSGCYNCAGAVAAGVVVGAAVGAAMATNSAQAVVVAPRAVYAIGAHYAYPPPGAGMISQGGNTYYMSGSTWFKASYGANGVYYTVVAAP